jgi:site-specific DNA recombinase
VTPQALSRIEARLLPEIDAAGRRALPRFASSLVAEVAGADAREWWAHLTIVQKWEVIWTPTEIRLMKSSRGGGPEQPFGPPASLPGTAFRKGSCIPPLL